MRDGIFKRVSVAEKSDLLHFQNGKIRRDMQMLLLHFRGTYGPYRAVGGLDLHPQGLFNVVVDGILQNFVSYPRYELDRHHRVFYDDRRIIQNTHPNDVIDKVLGGHLQFHGDILGRMNDLEPQDFRADLPPLVGFPEAV